MPGITNDEFMAEKITRTTLQREFRLVEILKGDNGDLQIRFPATDALAFANLLLSQALGAEHHPNALVTVCCPGGESKRLEIVSTWIESETLQEMDAAVREIGNSAP